MARYLTLFKYSTEGARGFQKDKASGRLASVKRAVEGLGGRLEALHWMPTGEFSGMALWEFPDAASFAAFGSTVAASGMFADIKTYDVLTSEEMDRAIEKSVSYRPPGG